MSVSGRREKKVVHPIPFVDTGPNLCIDCRSYLVSGCERIHFSGTKSKYTAKNMEETGALGTMGRFIKTMHIISIISEFCPTEL
jgi:hypothetical protein